MIDRFEIRVPFRVKVTVTIHCGYCNATASLADELTMIPDCGEPFQLPDCWQLLHGLPICPRHEVVVKDVRL